MKSTNSVKRSKRAARNLTSAVRQPELFVNRFVTPEPKIEQDEPEPILHIIDRPMYRVIITVSADGLDADFEIHLTAQGKRYAKTRGRGFHRRVETDEDALVEIFSARDQWREWQTRPDATFERRHFGNA